MYVFYSIFLVLGGEFCYNKIIGLSQGKKGIVMNVSAFRKKLFTYFLLGSLVSFSFVFTFLYYTLIPDIFKNEERLSQSTLGSMVNSLESFINQQIIETEAIKDSIAGLKSETEIKSRLDDKVSNLKHIKSIYAFNNNFSYGIPIAEKEDIISKITGKNGTVVFEMDTSAETNGIFIATPFVINNSNGYIVSQVNNSSVEKIIENSNKKETILIYGNNNKIICTNNNTSKFSQDDITLINSKYQALSNNIVEYNDNVAVIKNMLSTGWSMVSISSKQDFYHDSWLIIYKILGSIGVYILFTFILVILIVHLLINPINKIVNWIRAAQSNDFSFKISFSARDIFYEIAEGFSQIVQKLKTNYEELQKQTEELYERNWQVEEANKELEDSYQKLQETINQLNDAEEKYFALVRNIPEIVCVIEIDGTITFINNVVRDILGYNKDELVGKNIDLIIGQKAGRKFLNIMNKKLKKQSKVIVEIPMKRKDGREIVAEAKLTYFLRNGNIDGVQAIVRDITKNKKLQSEIIDRNKELLTIYNISKSLSSTIELDNVFKLIVNEVCKILNADMCILRLFDLTGRNLVMRANSGTFFEGIDESDLKEISILNAEKIKDILAGKQVVQKEISDLNLGIVAINNKKPQAEKISQVTFMPICAKNKVLGIIIVGAKTKLNDKRVNILNSIANNAAVAIENATLYENSKKYFIKTIDALIAAVEAKDKYTEGHSRRVSRYVEIIANSLGLPKERVEDLKIAGILHDVGKIGISDNILLKPGKLTPEEYEEVKQHPIISNRILYSVGLSEVTMKAIACHHERYDGKGYPFGLKEEELDIESQIIAVADAFDAMTSDRSYRRALSIDEAIKEIIRNKGTQFGPDVVDAILKMYESDFEMLSIISKDEDLVS